MMSDSATNRREFMTPNRREFFGSGADEPSGKGGSGEPARPIVPPTIIGVHHVKVPVGDVLRSRDWYIEVLGFTPLLDFEEEDRLIGVALQHPCGFTIGLHLDPERAGVLCGFPTVALCVGDADDLMDWSVYLDGRSIEHSPILEGHLGSFIELEDPDGLLVQLHTKGQPAADEA
jgi:catechol 2,3-dioxygenase-like lactoylglutathione lyase family enzyme